MKEAENYTTSFTLQDFVEGKVKVSPNTANLCFNLLQWIDEALEKETLDKTN